MRKLIEGKNAIRFPLWNTIANHGAQYPISSFIADLPAIYKTSSIRHQGFAGIRDNPLSRIRQPLAGGGK